MLRSLTPTDQVAPRLSQALQGRIWRKYAASLSLVTICFSLVSGTANVIASYEGAREAAFEALNGKAELATVVAETAFRTVEDAVAQTAKIDLLDPSAREPVRALEHAWIQSLRPEIVSLHHMDGADLAGMTRPADLPEDIAEHLSVERLRATGRYLSAVFLHDGSEPRVLFAVTDRGTGGGATVGVVSLMSISDALSHIRVGTSGYTYVVDADGQLISHSDASQVLANVRLVDSDQFRSATSCDDCGRHILEATSLENRSVYYSYATIPSLGWTVFAELPVDEALAPFYGSLLRSGSVLVFGLMFALAATVLLVKRIVKPLGALRHGAERLARGDLESRVVVETGDEIEELAAQFNAMAAEIKTRDQALRVSEERYALATRGARDGIWDWDLTTGQIYYSPRWSVMVGEPASSVLSTFDHWLSFVDPRDRRALTDAILHHLEGRTDRLRCEYRISRPDGMSCWMVARGRAVRAGDGQALRMAGSQSDISLLKQALEDLEAHRGRLEDLVEQRTSEARAAREFLLSAIQTAPDGLVMLDEHGTVMLANGRCGELLSRDGPTPRAGELDPKTDPLELIVMRSSDCRDKLEALRRQGQAFEHQMQVAPTLWVEISGRKMPVGGFVIRVADVSIYKRAEMALRQSLEKERELVEMQRNFVSMTSHQFRTPLAIIDSTAQRLLRRTMQLDTAEVTARAGLIRESVGRMTRLMESTLSLSQLDAGALSLRPRATDLEGLVRKICAVQDEFAPSVAVTVVFADFPPLVTCDPTLVEQAISNLVSNAIKFSKPDGDVAVTGWSENGHVVVSVADKGIGIPEGEVDLIFQRFFRAKNAEGIAGCGIGLNLVREVAAMHGGRVDLTSREGHGTTFTLRFPFEPHAAVADGAAGDLHDGHHSLH